MIRNFSAQVQQLKKQLKDGILDIFCGPGGLSLGFMQAGFDIVMSIDNNAAAIETIEYNHRSVHEKNGWLDYYIAMQRDLRDNSLSSEIEEHFKSRGYRVHGIIGGPPCKGFSVSNSLTRNMDNPHNQLFQNFIHLVKTLKPDFFVFENVPQIVTMADGKVINEIMNELNGKLGYIIGKKFLNAADYGVPQFRKRVIIQGFKRGVLEPEYYENDRLIDTAFPTPLPNNSLVTVKEAIFDLPEIGNGFSYGDLGYGDKFVSDYAKMMKRTSELNMESYAVLNHWNSKNSDKIIERYKCISQGGNWSEIDPKLLDNYRDHTRCHSGIYKRFNESEPCCALNNIRKSMYIHPTQDRSLSVREAARLQSFPDWYEFKGTLHDMQQMVADAVPPLMAKAIAENLKEILSSSS